MEERRRTLLSYNDRMPKLVHFAPQHAPRSVTIDGHMAYRPEIDGLRAIAVLSVVMFHYELGCGGGFTGVDIFFVISGFLIARNIVHSLETGGFTGPGFLERRARRLVPAAVCLIFAVLICGWFILFPGEYKYLGMAALAQSLGISNLFCCWKTQYFSGAARELPLLHTWSLSIEEQFYLILPLFLVPAFRAGALLRRASVAGILIALIAASAAVRFFGDSHFLNLAFYGLPSRLWEFLLGSLIVFLPPVSLRYRLLPELLSFAGISLIFSSIMFGQFDSFQGALTACGGAALFIWSNAARTICGGALSISPLRFIGLISYSLYLWHWPLLAFGQYCLMGEVPGLSSRLVMLFVSLLCAVTSWKFIEQPFRRRQIAPTHRQMITAGGIALVSLLLCGAAIYLTDGFPARFSTRVLEVIAAGNQLEYINELSAQDVLADRLVPIGEQSDCLSPRVLVWGDSHAMAVLPAVNDLLKENGMAGRAATHSAVPPVLDWCWENKPEKDPSLDFNNAVFAYVKKQNIQDVILCCWWDGYSLSAEPESARFLPALRESVRRLSRSGIRVWIVLDAPLYSINVPRALASNLGDSFFEAHGGKPVQSTFAQISHPQRIAELEAAGAKVIDPRPRFLDSTHRRYVTEAAGHVLYCDDNHLTPAGAKLMLLPLLRDAIFSCRK